MTNDTQLPDSSGQEIGTGTVVTPQMPSISRNATFTEQSVGNAVLQADHLPAYVYALGRVEPRFPSMALEKEFSQATGRVDSSGLTDRETIRGILSERANRYLARQLCWVFIVEGLDTYVISPRDPLDLDLLVESLRPGPRPTDLDVVIGIRDGMSLPELCNGLMLPIVIFDQLYSFDIETLVSSIPTPEGTSEERFRAAAEELLWRILQLSDNAGATDEYRALNYLTIRYPRIYSKTAEAYQENSSLTRVDARDSSLSGARKVVDVIFTYTDRQTAMVDQFIVRVDVTEEFPFLISKLAPYFDH